MNNAYFSVQSFCINKKNLNGYCHCNVFAVTFQNFEMASNYTFSKKLSKKGNVEMRTNFGFQKTIVLTYVNEYFYINLYNNSEKNPGRCSLSYSDFEELIRIKGIINQLKPKMVEVSLFHLI